MHIAMKDIHGSRGSHLLSWNRKRHPLDKILHVYVVVKGKSVVVARDRFA